MATYKILGQACPLDDTPTTLYQVTGVAGTIVSSIAICNVGKDLNEYYIQVIPSGETAEDKHYLIASAGIPVGDTLILTIGITLSPGDKLVVCSLEGKNSYQVFGAEIPL